MQSSVARGHYWLLAINPHPPSMRRSWSWSLRGVSIWDENCKIKWMLYNSRRTYWSVKGDQPPSKGTTGGGAWHTEDSGFTNRSWTGRNWKLVVADGCRAPDDVDESMTMGTRPTEAVSAVRQWMTINFHLIGFIWKSYSSCALCSFGFPIRPVVQMLRFLFRRFPCASTGWTHFPCLTYSLCVENGSLPRIS